MTWQARPEEYYRTDDPDNYSGAAVAATWPRLICGEKRKERQSEGTPTVAVLYSGQIFSGHRGTELGFGLPTGPGPGPGPGRR